MPKKRTAPNPTEMTVTPAVEKLLKTPAKQLRQDLAKFEAALDGVLQVDPKTLPPVPPMPKRKTVKKAAPKKKA